MDPTPDELNVMAYADGELSGEALTAFEARLSLEPSLAREVAELQALHVVARSEAPLEPADHEWRRLEVDSLQRTGLGIGWLLFIGTALLLTAQAVISIASDQSLSPWTRIFAVSCILGMGLLMGMTLRERLRVIPFDPYTKVQR